MTLWCGGVKKCMHYGYGHVSVGKHRNESSLEMCTVTPAMASWNFDSATLSHELGHELGLLKFCLRGSPAIQNWEPKTVSSLKLTSQGSPTKYAAPGWRLLAYCRVACRLLPVCQKPQQSRVTKQVKKLDFPQDVLITSSSNSEQQWTQTCAAEGKDYCPIILANYSPLHPQFRGCYLLHCHISSLTWRLHAIHAIAFEKFISYFQLVNL